MKNSIEFFNEHPSFIWNHAPTLEPFILHTLQHSNIWKNIDIRYILLSDEDLLTINQEHLNHDYYTDIITFDLSPNPEMLDADIYISIDRIQENAKDYEVTFEEELHRVFFHGILHLLGFKDGTEEEEKTMRTKENELITLFKNWKD